MRLFKITYELQHFYFGYVIYAPLAKMEVSSKGLKYEKLNHLCNTTLK